MFKSTIQTQPAGARPRPPAAIGTGIGWASKSRFLSFSNPYSRSITEKFSWIFRWIWCLTEGNLLSIQWFFSFFFFLDFFDYLFTRVPTFPKKTISQTLGRGYIQWLVTMCLSVVTWLSVEQLTISSSCINASRALQGNVQTHFMWSQLMSDTKLCVARKQWLNRVKAVCKKAETHPAKAQEEQRRSWSIIVETGGVRSIGKQSQSIHRTWQPMRTQSWPIKQPVIQLLHLII